MLDSVAAGLDDDRLREACVGPVGDAAGHRSSVETAMALADADGRPFPRALARTLAATTAAAAQLDGDPATRRPSSSGRHLTMCTGPGGAATSPPSSSCSRRCSGEPAHTEDARASLRTARERPGPYQRLLVDLVDRRLMEL